MSSSINMSKAGNADRQPAGHYDRTVKKCGYGRMYVIYIYVICVFKINKEVSLLRVLKLIPIKISHAVVTDGI